MPVAIKIKRFTTASDVPNTSELVDGEMLIDDSIPVADRARPSTKFNDFNM